MGSAGRGLGSTYAWLCMCSAEHVHGLGMQIGGLDMGWDVNGWAGHGLGCA
jgi:hypothetical protein